MISLFSYVYGLIIARRLIKREGYNPLWVNGVSMLSGGVMLLAYSAGFEEWYTVFPIANIGQFGFYVLLMALMGDVLAYNLHVILLRRYTATFLSFAGFMYPLFSAFLGWFFLSEGITWNFLISTGIAFIGLYIFYGEELNEK